MLAYFVALPDETKAVLAALVLGLVNTAVQLAIAYVPWLSFLEKYKEDWAGAVTVALITWLQNVLPSAYPDVAVLAVNLVLSILVAVGVIKKLTVKAGAQKLVN
jgi:hypothetical protein